MTMHIQVVLSPLEPLPEMDVWLVVDVLRATTTITTFFENGGRVLIPTASPEDAFMLKNGLGDEWSLMGEQNARKLDDFDLGNSPLDLLPDIVAEHPHVIMSTTNGTGALLAADASGRPVFAACVRNAAAAARAALDCGDNIGILCAGRYGRSALDDALTAGVLVDRLLTRNPSGTLDDGATMAYSLWRRASEHFLSTMYTAQHTKLLLELGLKDDVDFCASIDSSNTVAGLARWGEHPAFIHERE